MGSILNGDHDIKGVRIENIPNGCFTKSANNRYLSGRFKKSAKYEYLAGRLRERRVANIKVAVTGSASCGDLSEQFE